MLLYILSSLSIRKVSSCFESPEYIRYHSREIARRTNKKINMGSGERRGRRKYLPGTLTWRGTNTEVIPTAAPSRNVLEPIIVPKDTPKQTLHSYTCAQILGVEASEDCA